MTILDKLRQTNSGVEKRIILRSATPIEQKMFLFAYHPNKMYFQRFDSIDYSSIKEIREDTFNILDDIENRIHVGKAAREIIEQHSYYHGDLIKLICNKDLDCGVTEVSLNKVFGKDFIPTFNIQLAKEVDLGKVSVPCLGQIKYDGIRCLAFISEHGVILKTRSGKVFEYPILQRLLYRAKTTITIILDGELCIDRGLSEDRTSVSGIVNSAIKGTPIPIGTDVTFHVFDHLYMTEFDSRVCLRPYKIRKACVDECMDIIHCPKYVKEAVTKTLNTTEEINEFYEEVLGKGYEGLILKSQDHKYTFKRSKDWIKLKETKDADLLCIDVIEGKGKYEGGIGSLVCTGKVEGKEVTVNVGSGMSDVNRSLKPSDYIGKTIEVLYNSVIVDSKTGEYSLFLPRYYCVREDK